MYMMKDGSKKEDSAYSSRTLSAKGSCPSSSSSSSTFLIASPSSTLHLCQKMVQVAKTGARKTGNGDSDGDDLTVCYDSFGICLEDGRLAV
jgi:hypothetical protein